MQALEKTTRLSISNILFTTDFSPTSRAALPYAAVLARQYDAKLIVAHAVTPEPPLGVPLDPLPIEADGTWLQDQHKLAEFVQSDWLEKTAYEPFMERGDLWSVISDAIEKKKIDLVVVGTHGRRGFRKLVLGSNAERIYRQASCPVLTIGPKVPPLDHPDWKPKQILFPTDGSESSLHALPYALSLAEENQASLILLRLIPLVPWQYQTSEGDAARQALQALVPPEANDWCKPEFVVGFEFPTEGILTFAEHRKVDLIVLGVRRAAAAEMTAHLPWPIASQVVSLAHCPVLTVRG
jgi:nucleotide-binding universal stress UspA family protein